MLPSTKLYRLDLQFIADNCLLKNLWGKKWVIFQYDKVTVELYLSKIDINENKLYLDITLHTTDHGKYGSGWYSRGDIVIPLDKAQQNMDNALRQVVSIIKHKLINYEYDIARKYAGYKRARDLDDRIKEEATKRAIALLDAEAITNEDIRDAYIAACRDKVSTTYAGDFLSQSKGVVRPQYYLMLAAYFYPSDDKKYAEMLDFTKANRKTKWYQDYKDNVKEYLEAIYNDTVDEYITNMDMDLDEIKS